MTRYGSVGMSFLLVVGLMFAASAASAAPKTGCPVGTGWAQESVGDAAAKIWAGLIDQSPWASVEDFQETAVRPYDRNGDDSICLKTLWGDSLNPQARWYGIELYLPSDNTANASNK